MKMGSHILLTRLCGTWCNEYPVSGSHWRWRMRLQCRHPCSQTTASRPPACQAGCTAPQCGPAHHRSGPKCCMGTCARQAWVSVRDYWLRLVFWKKHYLTNRNPMDSFPYLVQSVQDMRMVIQNAVKGTINTIVHVVHQGSVIGPILFFCKN